MIREDDGFGNLHVALRRVWVLRMSRYLLRSGEASAYKFAGGCEEVRIYTSAMRKLSLSSVKAWPRMKRRFRSG